MKRHYKKVISKLVLLIMLFFSIFIIPFSLNVKGVEKQLNFVFDNEIYINSNVNINYTSDYNLRNPINYTNIYNATYTFTNETGIPTGWTDTSTGACTVDIIEELDGHNDTLEYDDVDGGIARSTTSFTSRPNGTVEYWVSTTDITKNFIFGFFDGANWKFSLAISGSNFKYYSTGWQTIAPVINNKWYHIRIDFECGNGNYLGLSADTFNVWINGLRYGAYPFENVGTDINLIQIETDTTANSYTGYIDAVDYSWDVNYSRNRNVQPLYSIINNTLEIDKYRFNYNDDLEVFPDGTDNPSGWTDIESNKDSVNTRTINGYTFVEIVDVVGASGNVNGLERTFSSTEMRIQTSLSFSMTEYLDDDDRMIFEIYSSDSTLIAKINLYTSGILGGLIEWWDGSNWKDPNDLSLLFLESHDIHRMELNIDYYSNNCFVEFYTNNTYISNFTCPLITFGKSGLSDVKAYVSFQSGFKSLMDFWIHDIGVYSNGTSLCDDSYGVIYDLNNSLDSDFYSLFTVGIEGDILQGALSLIDINFTESYDIISKGNYSDRTFFKNYYFDNINISNIAIVYLLTENTSISEINVIINSIYIRGVSLNEGSNKYWIEFEYGNVNIDNNYFYVDSLNRLRYNLTTNDNNTEYIQASFDIVDISSNNRFLSFKALLFGLATATYRVQFLTTSNIVVLDHLDRSYNEIISQGLTIDKFVLLITDDDSLYTGSTIGHFSRIALRYSELESTIITLMLITMIIPLIIILTPTIAISNIYGKNLIVPLFILTSIICVVSLIIPTWLFFIIGFCSLLFIYSKKNVLFEEI